MNKLKIILLLIITINLKAEIKDKQIEIEIKKWDNIDNYSITSPDDTDFDKIIDETSMDKKDMSLTIGYQFYPSLKAADDITSLDLGISKDINGIWLSAMFSNTSALFNQITQRNNQANPSIPSSLNPKETINSFGIGLGIQEKVPADIIKLPNVYAKSEAFITYNKLSESTFSENYSGIGIKTDIRLYKYAEIGMHYGTKLSYSLSQVTKKGDSSSDSRSLLISFISLGFDIGFYF